MKKNILLFLIVLLSTNCNPQNTYEKMVSNFFSTYATNPEKALDDIFKTS